MSVFKVDWKKLVLAITPTFLRGEFMRSLLFSAIRPLHLLWVQFEERRNETEFLVKYDTGRRNLEIALRKRFNDEGISVTNALQKEGLHIPFYLPSYFESAGYSSDGVQSYLPQYMPFFMVKTTRTDDFVISVPALTYLKYRDKISDFASYFVLPGFQYSVKSY